MEPSPPDAVLVAAWQRGDADAGERLFLAALRRIPVESQAVLELTYWEKMTAAEVAEVFDIAVGTAKSRLRRARQQLSAAASRIARAPELLESTMGGLERWVEQLREQLFCAP